MLSKTIEETISQLKEERSRIDAAIAQLEPLVGKGKTSTSSYTAQGSRQRAPRGLLREKIREVLGTAKKPMAPVQLRNAVIEAGYPVRDPKVFYATVFVTAKKDPSVKKTKEGFSLRKGAKKAKKKRA